QGFPKSGATSSRADCRTPYPTARRKSTRPCPRATSVAIGTADLADGAARRTTGPTEERHPGQGPGEGAEGQEAQGWSDPAAGTPAQPAHVDRPAPADFGGQSPVRRIGHRLARRRARSHVVAVHRRRRALLSAGQRTSAHRVAAAAKGSARTRRPRG